MIVGGVVVVPEAGPHARSVARFVRGAKRCKSEIVVVEDGAEANTCSSLRLMMLGATGEDEPAVEALVGLILTGKD